MATKSTNKFKGKEGKSNNSLDSKKYATKKLNIANSDIMI